MDRFILEVDEVMCFVITIGETASAASPSPPGTLTTHYTALTGRTGILENQETEEG